MYKFDVKKIMERDSVRLVVLLFVVTFSLAFNSVFAVSLGTPPFNLQPKIPLNPLYPAAFYYDTDDSVIIYDTVLLYNVDPDRSVTLELTGVINNSEGWFAFEDNVVEVPPRTVKNVVFSITIPDGVCEGMYTAYVYGSLQSYTDMPVVDGGFAVNAVIGVETMLNIQSAYDCPVPLPLPGLGAPASFVPPPTIMATILEDEPVIIPVTVFEIIPPPPVEPPVEPPIEPPVEEPVEPPVEEPVEPPVEEPILGIISLKAHPEKRVPSVGNWSTRGVLNLYSVGIADQDYIFAAPVASNGLGVIENTVVPGYYHASYKGLSHLTKFIRDVSFGPDVNLDYTFGGSFDLLAGDVAIGKDDFVNSLDISATTAVLYGGLEDADLNLDTSVNGLDLSIEIYNIYKSGEKLIQ